MVMKSTQGQEYCVPIVPIYTGLREDFLGAVYTMISYQL